MGLPRYARGKEVRRRGYARYRFLRGFRVSLRGRRVVYGVEWVTVRLPVLYRGGERVRTCLLYTSPSPRD